MYLKDLRYGDAFLHMGMDIGVIEGFSFIKWMFSNASSHA